MRIVKIVKKYNGASSRMSLSELLNHHRILWMVFFHCIVEVVGRRDSSRRSCTSRDLAFSIPMYAQQESRVSLREQ